MSAAADSQAPSSSREFDLILYGATGFTGRQATAYLQMHAPRSLRWAIAGRDQTRLTALGAEVPSLIASTDRPGELDYLTRRTGLVLNMAGPFKLHGDPLVASCIRAGTDYCDISGETARIRGLIERHHDEAEALRLRIVPFCGASSVPADVAVYLLDERLEGELIEARVGLSIEGGSFNGGTIASITDAIESGDARAEVDPFLLGPFDRGPTTIEQDPKSLHFDEHLRAWTIPSPMGMSDTRAVRRSAQLLGRDIVFQEYLIFEGKGSLPRAVRTFALLAGVDAAFRWRYTRQLLGRAIKPGSGPTDRQMDAGKFSLRAWGRTVAGVTARIRLSAAGDPGNRITVKCACESALALALDREELPDRFGVLTPSVALGKVLPRRLIRAGIELEDLGIPA